MVLPRLAIQPHATARREDQVPIRRGDVNLPRVEWEVIHGVRRQERPRPAQDIGKYAPATGREVADDKDTRRETARQPAGQLGQCIDTAGGRADHDHVAACHFAPSVWWSEGKWCKSVAAGSHHHDPAPILTSTPLVSGSVSGGNRCPRGRLMPRRSCCPWSRRGEYEGN